MKLQINEFERVAKIMVGFPPGQGSAAGACRFKIVVKKLKMFWNVNENPALPFPARHIFRLQQAAFGMAPFPGPPP